MTTSGLEQRIRVLPESVINQIAAGEVVLRPASVIKELGENAIDAEAQQISFWTEAGGKNLIQVTDDGIGMSPIDAELCFERHATSKIATAQDLYALCTKGFRGEALASIAAVAEVELFTRRPTDEIGTHVIMAFGKKRLSEPVRCAVGTTIIVRKLFQRVPVRRKSLRSDLTEHRHNLQEFFRLAYPHPERHFRFYHNKLLVVDLPPASLSERILSIHPELSEEALIPLAEETPLFKVWGYAVLPELTPPGNREGFLFINGRYIRHAGLQHVIGQVYKPLLPPEVRPLYWVFLEVPPAQVDVNVTPAKTEARLVHEMEIRKMLGSVFRQALAKSKLALPADWLSHPSAVLEMSVPAAMPAAPRVIAPSLGLPSPEGPALQYLLLQGRFLVLNTAEGESWLIDLLGAHERILYEKYLRGQEVVPQGLLFPALAPVSPLQCAQIAELKPLLQAQGLEIEIREGKEVVLHAIPAGLRPAAAGAILEALLEVAASEALPPDWRELMARHIARYGALRPPYTLAPEAVQTLWQSLLACEEPNYSPSGRRIRFLLSAEALERLFK